MRKLFNYIGISAIVVFSFYYTERINNIVVTNSALFSEINEKSTNYEIKPVNATIDGNYIIPGLNGLNIDLFSSYHNMKSLDVFNENYLVYDESLPTVSVKENIDKIIVKGNSNKKSVAIILKDNKNIIDYSYSKNILFSRLVTIDTYDEVKNYEQINNETAKFKKLDNILNKKHNSNICVVNSSNEEVCRKYRKFLVKESLKLSNYNIGEVKSLIESGSIIFVDDNVSLADYKILIKQIYYQDLDIVWLSTLINEERD